MGLGTIINRTAQEIFLAEKMEKALRSSREIEPMDADNWLRVSSIGGLCQREETLCSLYNITRKEIVQASSVINFAVGDAIHWMVQNRILPGTVDIIGKWRCTWCGETYGSRSTEMVPRPESCIRCGAIAGEPPRRNGRPDEIVNGEAFLYMEEWIGNSEYKIGGSPDGQFCLGYYPGITPDKLTLLEVKSANDRNFAKYKLAPDPMHVVQANTYMWLTGYPRAKILYFNKNGFGIDAIKEHDLEYDEEMIDNLKAILVELRELIRDAKIAPRTLCANSSCERAKFCQVGQKCFELE